MRKSIIPNGFASTSHPIFFNYVPPLLLPDSININSIEGSENQSNFATKSKSRKRLLPTNDSSSIGVNKCLKEARSIRNLECSICLSNFCRPVTIVSCRHTFCIECLTIWFRTKVSCPLCKSSGAHFVGVNHELGVTSGVKIWAVDGGGLEKVNPKDLHQALMFYLDEIVSIDG